MAETLSTSRFDMWRAVVAMAHADGIVTPHEISFINEHMYDFQLTQEQKNQISMDLRDAQNIFQMFERIENDEDRKDFFVLARALSWCDGDFDAQEEKILNQLALNESQERLLSESREIIQEVELLDNQWVFKTPKSKNLFSFLQIFQSST